MTIPLTAVSHFRLELPRHAVFTVQDVAGVGIACHAGSVWLTLDDDPRDLVLEPGERFEGDIHRRVLVSAFEDSHIEVSHALPAALPVPQQRIGAPHHLPRVLSPA
ncbi:DUF2917 domain-containing protein [Variovorax sp.]|uniref:DUF2917 domain-containing protein n=1 Tax=Variovorax sp. TaxID=1871043 RepID=UPI002D2548BA|nr:DUF2917 domain-containing protein [Variovorax sp.]HYP84135.1 DUF2917 domain-containing protein [Variovorax sp.]